MEPVGAFEVLRGIRETALPGQGPRKQDARLGIVRLGFDAVREDRARLVSNATAM
jgi:hypothetical protein